MRADVIVVGLGSMGASASYHLAERGLRVIGLDRFSPPHDRGAHAGGSRIIRMAYMEGAEYVPLVRRSYELWRELEDSSGERLVTSTGGLMLGLPTATTVAGAAAAASAHGLPHEMLDRVRSGADFPVSHRPTMRSDSSRRSRVSSGRRPRSVRTCAWPGNTVPTCVPESRWRAGPRTPTASR